MHQRVRHKLAAVVARREAQAAAEAAIASAQALLEATPIAVKRLAEVDRDWSALAADLLDAPQREAFAALRGRLDAALQAQDDARRAAQWSAQATPALAELESACAAGDLARIEACRAALQSRLDACPAVASTSELAGALRAALEAARDAIANAAEAAAETCLSSDVS